MLCLLAKLSDYFGPLRLFDYATFRAGGAIFFSFAVVVFLGPAFSRFLKRRNFQAAQRYEGIFDEEWIDREKEKTPSMGGCLIISAIVLSCLLFSDFTNSITIVLLISTIAFSILGFADDYLKIFKKQKNGLPGKLKIIGQLVIAITVVIVLRSLPETGQYMEQVMIPFVKTPLNWGWIGFAMSVFVIVGASNAVNLTDGKDGLATGCTIFCVLTYAAFAYLMGHYVFANYLNIPHITGINEALVYSCSIIGACIGFLWHNCYPASIFMGDTGSLALGGGVGMLAVLTRQELLLIVVGGVFVMEAVSVIIQVTSFKLTGKRVFLCTPIHHHFERKGWTETQIVVRFWILSGIFALLALATLKLR